MIKKKVEGLRKKGDFHMGIAVDSSLKGTESLLVVSPELASRLLYVDAADNILLHPSVQALAVQVLQTLQRLEGSVNPRAIMFELAEKCDKCGGELWEPNPAKFTQEVLANTQSKPEEEEEKAAPAEVEVPTLDEESEEEEVVEVKSKPRRRSTRKKKEEAE